METSIAVRISVEEKERLKAVAKEMDLSVSQLVRRLIRDFINEE